MVEQSAGEVRRKRDDTPKGIGLGYIIHQQVAGVLGALALASVLGHFVESTGEALLPALLTFGTQLFARSSRQSSTLRLLPSQNGLLVGELRCRYWFEIISRWGSSHCFRVLEQNLMATPVLEEHSETLSLISSYGHRSHFACLALCSLGPGSCCFK